MNIYRELLLILGAFLISFLMVHVISPKILLLSLRKRLLDGFDPRKVHSVPASRLGGVVFLPAIAFAFWLMFSFTHLEHLPFVMPIAHDIKFTILTVGLILLFLIGVYDDLIGARYKYKFYIQITVAVLLVWSGVYVKNLHGFFGICEISEFVGMTLTLLFFVFVINAINLIDGIDGLASLLSIMAFVGYGAMFLSCGMIQEALFCAATLGALIPFCRNNIIGVRRGVKSKIFMGDTGSLVIGTILGFMTIKLWDADSMSQLTFVDRYFYILAYTALIIPCFDVVRVVFHRYRNKKSIFLPDKNHIHHKFMALRYTARQALVCIILMNTLFLVLNMVLAIFLDLFYIVIIDIIVWVLIHVLLSKAREKLE